MSRRDEIKTELIFFFTQMKFFEIFTIFGDDIGELTGLFWVYENVYFVNYVNCDLMIDPS